MQSFQISESTKFLCIGPLESALRASTQLQNQADPPQCWSRGPTRRCGGTVLVHDVDMRVPVRAGGWFSDELFHGEQLAGGMVWHASLGGGAAAAALIHRMEDAGASTICNTETEAVLAQGVRLIGRYSWNPHEDVEHAWLNSEEKTDKCYALFGGPECFFVDAETLNEVALPLIDARLAALDELDATAHGEEEDALDDDGERERESDARRDALQMPRRTHFAGRGVAFSFARHEYLFGRLWFDGDGRCVAFLCFTYAAPEYLGETRVGEHAVCPALLSALRGVGNEDNEEEDFVESLARVLDDAALRDAVRGLTAPMRDAFLFNAVRRDASLCARVLAGDDPALAVDEEVFDTLFRVSKWSWSETSEDALLTALRVTPNDVLERVVEKEQARFARVDAMLRDGSYPFHSFSEEKTRCDAASLVAGHLDKPRLLRALLGERGVSASRMLAATEGDEWPRSALAEAALCGHADAVRVLLDLGGAAVDEAVGGDPWSAIVYAAAGRDAETLDVFRERCGTHGAWTARDIPLAMKSVPDRALMRDSEDEENENAFEEEEDEERDNNDDIEDDKKRRARKPLPEAFLAALRDVGEVGTLQDVVNRANALAQATEEEARQRNASRGFGKKQRLNNNSTGFGFAVISIGKNNGSAEEDAEDKEEDGEQGEEDEDYEESEDNEA